MIETPIKRGRGRPRKDASLPIKQVVEPPVVKRGRGRPKKSIGTELIKSTEEVKHLKNEVVKVEEEPPIFRFNQPKIQLVNHLNYQTTGVLKVATLGTPYNLTLKLYNSDVRPFLITKCNDKVHVHVFDKYGAYVDSKVVDSEQKAKEYATTLKH